MTVLSLGDPSTLQKAACIDIKRLMPIDGEITIFFMLEILPFVGAEGPQALFRDRILAFDDRAGLVWARLMAEGKTAGRPRSALDMIIAAVAGANDCVVVTDNDRNFVGIQFINPLRDEAT